MIELAYYGGFSHTEIAAMLDTPVGTIKGRMRLGLKKMRSQLRLRARAVVGRPREWATVASALTPHLWPPATATPPARPRVSCSSCGRPICPDCMTPTQVGMRCPECASQRTKVVRMREMAAVPRVTYALIAINVIVYLAEQGQFTLTGSRLTAR